MVVRNGYSDNIDLLKQEYRVGTERRRNWTKQLLEMGTPMPKPIKYKDIDSAFKEWVEKDLNISYEDKEVPTISLYSNQRISEYVQTWQYKDKHGNLQMNLKTITRELNPKWGDMYEKHNIPSDRHYSVYYVPIMGENGQVTYDRWSIGQPLMVNFSYTLQIITNKLELLNDFNELVNKKFEGINCYLFPLGHPMPMKLDDIGDQSEYNIDNRKYYSQKYAITLKGYILREEDMKVEKMPTRWKPTISVIGVKPIIKKTDDTEVAVDYREICEEEVEETRYTYRNVSILMKTGLCNKPIEFVYNADTEESEFVIKGVKTDNIDKFELFINDEVADFDDDVRIMNGDNVKVTYYRKDIMLNAEIQMFGYDNLQVVDELEEEQAETVLDEREDYKDLTIDIL